MNKKDVLVFQFGFLMVLCSFLTILSPTFGIYILIPLGLLLMMISTTKPGIIKLLEIGEDEDE